MSDGSIEYSIQEKKWFGWKTCRFYAYGNKELKSFHNKEVMESVLKILLKRNAVPVSYKRLA